MSEQTPPPVRKKNRETILLLIVLGVGLAGLAVLYFSRQSAARAAERALLQAKSAADAQAADAQASRPIQSIPGNLIRIEEQPEARKPFIFEMTNFAQGATYELDPGDGTGRQVLVNGKLRHVYQQRGDYTVTLYARYQGQEAVLQTAVKNVAPYTEITPVAPLGEF